LLNRERNGDRDWSVSESSMILRKTPVWNRAVAVIIMFHPPGFELNAPKLPRRDL